MNFPFWLICVIQEQFSFMKYLFVYLFVPLHGLFVFPFATRTGLDFFRLKRCYEDIARTRLVSFDYFSHVNDIIA